MNMSQSNPPVALQMTSPMNTAAGVALASGIAVGLVAVYEKEGAFTSAALQGGLTAGAVSYLMPQYTAMTQAAVAGAVLAAACAGFQGFPGENCMKYGAVSAAAVYLASSYLAPSVTDKLNQWRGSK